MAGKLGELLIRDNLITPAQLQKALEEQKRAGGGWAQTSPGWDIKEEQLTEFLSKQYGVPAVNLKEFEIDPEVIKLIPEEVARKHVAIPVNRAGSTLIVAMADPSQHLRHGRHQVPDRLQHRGGGRAPSNAIKEAIERYYAASRTDLEEVMEDLEDLDIELGGGGEEVNVSDLEKATEDAPVVKLVNLILTDAIKKRASDIHVEPYEKSFRVRYRIDGVLYEVMKPPMKLKNADRQPHQDHERAGHRRAAAAPGRPHQAQARQGQGDGLPRLGPARRCSARRSSCGCSTSRNLQLDMTKLGFERGAAQATSRTPSTGPTAWCWSPAPPGRARPPRSTRRSPSSTRSTDNISTAEDPVEYNLDGHQPGADARGDRPELRRRAARLPAAGPGHHHGRRDPRLRDRGDRASRPPSPATWCSPPCTPTTRPRPSTACSTWASSRSWSPARST